jgi:hypothetical protein
MRLKWYWKWANSKIIYPQLTPNDVQPNSHGALAIEGFYDGQKELVRFHDPDYYKDIVPLP